jgi:predicted 2-oxoglutarate/Fe(II)-dependent dioxygenase YbiX
VSNENFYIVAKESGAENSAIPTWANDVHNPAELDPDITGNIERREVENVPGAFQLTGVLTAAECERLITVTESLGYVADAAVSLPRSVRHNDSLAWVVDDETSNLIWGRCGTFINRNPHLFYDSNALGLNNRFRFYRYREGDYFSPHTDGSWPGSRVVNRRLVHNAFDDRWSQLTLLLFLNDDFEGGSTEFQVRRKSDNMPETVSIRTPQGGVLCFPHGTHPMHCLHSSGSVTKGVKYIIRSDVLFEI